LAVEGKRVPSPASQAAGDILYRGGTEWERLAKGTAGQVLTMNSGATAPEWADASGGGDISKVISWSLDYNSYKTCYSDCDTYATTTITGTITLHKTLSYNCIKYLGGVKQEVARTTIWADAANTSIYPVIYDGYVYVSLHKTTATAETRVYRCSLSDSISTAGNWTQMTVSGTGLDTGNNTSGLIGFGNNALWYLDKTNSRFIPYTISGTTLTGGTAVTVTGTTYSKEFNRVNGNGIYTVFSSAPYLRKAGFNGTLDSNKQFCDIAPNALFVTDKGIYIPTSYDGALIDY
jgi:hypothetical protein